ncbi:hypothetical protein KY338_05410 [Candidatus Woesearchaeota archaeon]|nr:hypothetical protein [Candidatus Woesearchaeota archaeon]MBW3006340.1 hypothetical protein [Candidatus Woesearchaeota archaeon]
MEKEKLEKLQQVLTLLNDANDKALTIREGKAEDTTAAVKQINEDLTNAKKIWDEQGLGQYIESKINIGTLIADLSDPNDTKTFGLGKTGLMSTINIIVSALVKLKKE